MNIYSKILKFYSLFFVFLLLGFFCQLISAASKLPDVKADQIISRAKEQTQKGKNPDQIKSLSLEMKLTTTFADQNGQQKQSVGDSKLSLMLPDMFKIERFTDYTTNQQLFTQTLNANKYHDESQQLVDGKPINFKSNLSELTPKTTQEQKISGMKRSVFKTVFPMFFDTSWYSELEFKYIGESSVDDKQTDVIEAANSNGTFFRMHFDKVSGLPILMTETIRNPFTNKEVERKTFYLDYKIVSGYLIAHRVLSQRSENYTEDFQLKKVQINPTIKANLFEVKEN